MEQPGENGARDTLADWLEGLWCGEVQWIESTPSQLLVQEGWGSSDISLLSLCSHSYKIPVKDDVTLGRTENQVDTKLGFSLLPTTRCSSRNSYCASSVFPLYSVTSSSLNVHLQEICPPSVETTWLVGPPPSKEANTCEASLLKAIKAGVTAGRMSGSHFLESLPSPGVACVSWQ